MEHHHRLPRFLGSAFASFSLVVLTASSAATASRPDCDDGGPAPDRKLKDNSALSEMPSETLSGLIDYVRDNFDEGLGNEMSDALQGPDPCVEVCENWSKNGSSDATTISVGTLGKPAWLAAAILVHEYHHWLRSRPASVLSGDPYETDPETSADNPCGECAHADMGADDIARLAYLCESGSQDDISMLCNLTEEARKKIAQKITACVYRGCTSCCGFSYIPNVDEILVSPPCCQ